MGIIKHRPRISLLVEREIHAGAKHNGTVVVDSRRQVPIDWLRVIIKGFEQGTIGSGQYSRTERQPLVRLEARLADKRTFAEGRTEFPFRFELPTGLPPSYRGSRARAWYTAEVRASIPWWPDAKATFEIHVAPAPRAALPGPPLLFSSAPSGPTAREPHVEGSLAGSVFESGGVVSGALAVGNVRWNDYRAFDVGLVAVETLTLPRARPQAYEASRFEVTVPLVTPAEGESVPFRFRLPDGLPPSYTSGLWRLAWHFDARVRVRWRSDVRLRVPVTVVPAMVDDGRARPYQAPPSVGSERVERLWRKVGEELELDYRDGTLSTRIGEVDLEVRREHRGRSGVFLVGEVTYPSLHLDLEIRPARGLGRHLGGSVDLGKHVWDRRHLVRGREPEQVRPAAKLLREVLLHFAGATVDDERALVEIRGAGQGERKLLTFCQAARALAASIEPARAAVPPPGLMTKGLDGWRALAERLAAPLDTARMAVLGELDGMPAEVRTEWSKEGDPLRTLLRVEPPIPISSEYEAHLEVGEGEPAGLEGWSAPRGTPREVAAQLLDGARALDVTTTEVRLSMPAPIVDPAPLVGRLAEMARLAVALRPGSGPFR